MSTLPPIECAAWECQVPGCFRWHPTLEAAEKCCPPCKCPECDGSCRRQPVKCPAIRCPDCGYLDDLYGNSREDMVARRCCGGLPVDT